MEWRPAGSCDLGAGRLRLENLERTMRRTLLACLLLAAACGGAPSTPAPSDAEPTTPTQPFTPGSGCIRACAGLQCGDDGCGGSCGACSDAQVCTAGTCVALSVPPTCTPACTGKACGDDGCGGSCGNCAAGATCTGAGACQAPPSSPGCPQGGVCTYLQRTAWSYDCSAPDDCRRTTAIADYGTFEACRTWGCMNGNSRCGDQFGNSDAERWSCEACKLSCDSGVPSLCGAERETASGCALSDSVWGPYLADCICE
jgi:hypothetical protein